MELASGGGYRLCGIALEISMRQTEEMESEQGKKKKRQTVHRIFIQSSEKKGKNGAD